MESFLQSDYGQRDYAEVVLIQVDHLVLLYSVQMFEMPFERTSSTRQISYSVTSHKGSE